MQTESRKLPAWLVYVFIGLFCLVAVLGILSYVLGLKDRWGTNEEVLRASVSGAETTETTNVPPTATTTAPDPPVETYIDPETGQEYVLDANGQYVPYATGEIAGTETTSTTTAVTTTTINWGEPAEPPPSVDAGNELALPPFSTFAPANQPVFNHQVKLVVVGSAMGTEGGDAIQAEITMDVLVTAQLQLSAVSCDPTVDAACDASTNTKDVVYGFSLEPDPSLWTYAASFPFGAVAWSPPTAPDGRPLGEFAQMTPAGNPDQWPVKVFDPVEPDKGFQPRFDALTVPLVKVGVDAQGETITQLVPDLVNPMWGAFLSSEACLAQVHQGIFDDLTAGVADVIAQQGIALAAPIYQAGQEEVAASIAATSALPEHHTLDGLAIDNWSNFQVVSVSLDGEVCGGGPQG